MGGFYCKKDLKEFLCFYLCDSSSQTDDRTLFELLRETLHRKRYGDAAHLEHVIYLENWR